MKHISKVALSFSVLLISQSAFAYYCSTQAGQGYINVGDSMAQVQQACGNATNAQTQDTANKEFKTTEYWMYSNAKVANSVSYGTFKTQTNVTQEASPAVFQIENGIVTGITDNGSNVQSVKTCGPAIKVGDSSKNVLSSCGNPTSTNMQNKPSDKKNKITTWTYDQGQFSQPLVLEFTDGKLSKIGG